MPLDHDSRARFLTRVNRLLAEAQATKATMAHTDRLLARELAARRDETLRALRANTYSGGSGRIPARHVPEVDGRRPDASLMATSLPGSR